MSERKQSTATEFPEVPSLPTVGLPPEVAVAFTAHNKALSEWYQRLNGRISLGSPRAWSGHIDGEWLDVVVPAPNTDFAVAHNLNRVPMAFIVADGGVLTRNASTPAHTKTQVWMRSSAAAGSLFRVLAF